MRLQQEEELKKTYRKVSGHFEMQLPLVICIRIFFFFLLHKYFHPSPGGLCMTEWAELRVTKVVCHMIVLGCSVLKKAVCESVVCVCVCD